MLGEHLREEPGEKVRLQQASQSLLQGTTRLLELGEECITERQMNQVHNRNQLQAVLCRHKVSHCVLSTRGSIPDLSLARSQESGGLVMIFKDKSNIITTSQCNGSTFARILVFFFK